MVAGGCDILTSGACVIATPGTYAAGAVGGGFIGGALGWLAGSTADILMAKPPDNAWDPNGPKALGNGDRPCFPVDIVLIIVGVGMPFLSQSTISYPLPHSGGRARVDADAGRHWNRHQSVLISCPAWR
jgi:hypothetical protein